MIFLGLALFAQSWNRTRAWDEVFLLTTLLPGLSFVFFFVQERYIAALIPTLFIWFGHGVIVAGNWLTGTARHLLPTRWVQWPVWRQLGWLPLMLIALFLLFFTPYRKFQLFDSAIQGADFFFKLRDLLAQGGRQLA